MAKKSQPPEQGEPVEFVRANLERQVETSPDFVSLYANDVQIQTSPWDVRLVFGQIHLAPAPDKPATVRQLGEVRLSPQLAKRLTTVLLAQLKGYEGAFGPIPSPPD